MITFTMPWVFVLFPLPFAIYYLLPPKKNTEQEALFIPFYDAFKTSFETSKKMISYRGPFVIFSLIWTLLLLGASDPVKMSPPISLAREGRNIMLVMDLSPSMALPDMISNGRPATRLSIVQEAARDFISSREDARFGLILFGSRAYLQTPLTFDKRHLLMRIDDATPGLAGQTTSIGDAVGLAVKRLMNAHAKHPVIILLTDGANNSGVLPPEKGALLAKKHDIPLYTIGLGSESLISLSTTQGADSLDESTLEKMAALGNGRYFRATDKASLKNVYQIISELIPEVSGVSTVHPKKHLYPWPLGCAFFLFCFILTSHVIPSRARDLQQMVRNKLMSQKEYAS